MNNQIHAAPDFKIMSFMADTSYTLSGLVALALVGFTLYRRTGHHSTISFRPHTDAEGTLMCFALGKRLTAPPIRTNKP